MFRWRGPVPWPAFRTPLSTNSRTTSAASFSRAARPEPTMTGTPVGRRILALANRCAPGLTLVAILALWEIACRVFDIPTFLLPSPSLIVTGALDQSWSTWAGHIWATVRVALMGYAMAIVISIPLAVMLATSAFLARTLYPLIVGIHSIPTVALTTI